MMPIFEFNANPERPSHTCVQKDVGWKQAFNGNKTTFLKLLNQKKYIKKIGLCFTNQN